jgi:copper chaperone CopZ
MKYKITIQGMHCASCAKIVERQLGKVEGVKSVNVSVISKEGVVESNGKIKEMEIKKAVDKAGYKATEVKKE